MIANPLKGEVSLEAPSGETYVLVLNANTLAALHEAWNLDDINDVLERVNRSARNMRDLRTVFWCSLQKHHPQLSEMEVGELLTEIAMADVSAKVVEAFAKSFGARKGRRANGAAGPRKGGSDGASGTSSSSGAGSPN